MTGPFRISTGFPILPDIRGTARYSVSKRTVARRKMPVKVYLRWVFPKQRLAQPAKLPKAAPDGKIGSVDKIGPATWSRQQAGERVLAASAAFGHSAFRHVSNPVRIHAGDNALERLGEEADRARARRVLVVCGQTVAHHTNLLDRVKQALGDKLAGVFQDVRAGSPATSVLQGVARAASLGPDLIGPDLIVAVGGGSAVVTARAITIMLAEGGTLHDHATKYPTGEQPVSPRLMQPKVPNIVVLTTPTTSAHRAGMRLPTPRRATD